MTVTVTGPFTLTPPAPVSLPLPQSGGAVGWLVLDNLSAFLLQVNVGAQTFYQAPLVENVYDLRGAGGQPITVTGIVLPDDSLAGITTGSLAPTWYSSDETLPNRNWPIALSGPAEIAAATAAAILQTGVPNVLTSTLIDTTNDGLAHTYDVHTFATLEIVAKVGPPVAAEIIWQDSNGATPHVLATDNIQFEFGAQVPVQAPFVRIFYTSAIGAGNPTVATFGTNRPVPQGHAVTAGFSGAGATCSTGITVMAAGTAYALNFPANSQLFQGPAAAYVCMQDPTVTGFFRAVLLDGTNYYLTDTNNLSGNTANIGRSKNVQLALPANLGHLEFLCELAGTTDAILNLVPAY